MARVPEDQSEVAIINEASLALLNAEVSASTDSVLVSHLTGTARWLGDLGLSFLTLQRNSPGRSHKVLIRSMLESVFYLGAVCLEPEAIWGVFCHQSKSEWKLVAKTDLVTLRELSDQKARLRSVFHSRFGHPPTNDHPTNARDAAKAAGMEIVYDTFYRYYSAYSHGTLRAIAGGYDSVTDPADQWLAAMLLVNAVQHLRMQHLNIEFDADHHLSALLNRQPPPP